MRSDLSSSPKESRFPAVQRFFFWLCIACAVLGGGFFGYIAASVALRKDLALLKRYRPSRPTLLYDRNAKVFAELYLHRQELLTLQEVPSHVVHAFLAVEDRDFFHHFGIDFRGILRALWKNIFAGRIVQGGSTITQQLAKQVYLNTEGRRFRTLIQKIRETILALQIEEAFSKEEILELFFNVIYLGHGCKGLVCASRLYFDKEVKDMSIAEAAVLARLPRAPVNYSPYKNPKQARKVHLYVLRKMAEAGYLDAKDIPKIHKSFWEKYWPKIIVRSPAQSAWGGRLNKAPYFTEYVRQILERIPEVGPQALYSQSLRVYTTLDQDHQRIAQQEMDIMHARINKVARSYALSKGVSGVDFELFHVLAKLRYILALPKPLIVATSRKEDWQKLIEGELLDGIQLLSYLSPGDNETAAFDAFRHKILSNYLQLQVQQAFVSIEHRTGYITSMIGGHGFSPRNQFNRVLQAYRQPGSAFKIFVYGSALEERLISTMTPINDAPLFRSGSDGSSWTPENYEPGFRGLVSAKRALASSLNTCAVQLYLLLGAQPIIDFAGRLLKMPSPKRRLKEEPALALGASEISPMELATAVAIIANEGKDVIPFAVRYVQDQTGSIIYNQEERVHNILAMKAQEKSLQIIEPALAHILQQMLRYVSDAGTARYGLRAAEWGNFQGDIASKTGTTSNYSDAWITGFNPEYAATVWFGFDKSSVTMGPGHSGGGVAAPVLGRFFRRIYKDKPASYPSFPKQGRKPAGTIISHCQGIALAPLRIGGKKKKLQEGEPCTGETIYDERRLLMEEMNITPEDLGAKKGTLKFQ